jgi:hypothetical protein
MVARTCKVVGVAGTGFFDPSGPEVDGQFLVGCIVFVLEL